MHILRHEEILLQGVALQLLAYSIVRQGADDDDDDRDDDGGGSSCGDIVLGPASLLLPSSLLTNACRCMYEYGYW